MKIICGVDFQSRIFLEGQNLVEIDFILRLGSKIDFGSNLFGTLYITNNVHWEEIKLRMELQGTIAQYIQNANGTASEQTRWTDLVFVEILCE